MNEEKAIEILKKVKRYYNMHRSGYNDVIKWLERKQRKKLRDKKKAGST